MTRNTDGSIIIDYTAANQTKRYFAVPPTASSTPDMIAQALIFKDMF